MKAINFAIARFDTEIKDAFLSLYKKIDDSIVDPNHKPVDLNSGVHVALKTIVDQIADQHQNELEDLVQTGVIDVALTKEFVSENISMLLPSHNKCMK